MRTCDDSRIRVQFEWSSWHTAEVRLANLREVHWFQPTRAPHALVHAYILCSDIVTGHIPHECEGQSASHRLRVCVLKRHILPEVYSELARRADERRGVPYTNMHAPHAVFAGNRADGGV